MNIPCRSPLHGHSAYTSRVRLRCQALVTPLLFAFLALLVVSCAPGSGSSTPMCTNCMTDPGDNEKGVMNWCGTHVPSPSPSCIRTGFTFRGYVDSPNTHVTIEAKLLNGNPADPWYKVDDIVSIDSEKGPPYAWSKWVALDYSIWEVAQDTSPASVKYSGSVRSKSPAAPLASLIYDRYNCYSKHPAAFLANCTAPLSPEARIIAVADFGQDCVNLVNLVRRVEGVSTELQEFQQEESLADQDAKTNYENGAHYSMHGMGQNETATYDAYDQILDISIYHHMYFLEKQYHNTGTCNEPAVCKTDGHYLHIISTKFTKLACGIYVTPDRKFHAVMNFYQ